MRDFIEKEIRKKKCRYRLDCRKKRGRTFSEKKICWQCLDRSAIVTCCLCSRASGLSDALRHLAMPSGYLIPALFLFRPSNFRTVSTGNNLSSGFAAISHPLFPFFSVQGNQPSTSQYPSSGLTGHYPYTIHFFLSFFFFSFFLFFSHTQQPLFWLRRSAQFFFSLPEDGTEIGRKHRQMLEAVCLTI